MQPVPLLRRGNRGKDAVARVGSPIVAAGVTTFLAVIPMLGCTIQVLAKFGAIIPACIVLSLFYRRGAGL
jgi:multidrug efflux pump subunit AcrB